MVLNSPLLVWKALISPSNLKKSLARRVVLIVRFYVQIYCAIAFWLVEFLLGNQLIAWWEFPCMFFVIFSLLLLIFYLCLDFCQLDYYVSWSVPSCVYPAWDSLCFLYLIDCFLSHVWQVFSYYVFKYFLRSFLSIFSFWDPYNANVGAFNVVPEVS